MGEVTVSAGSAMSWEERRQRRLASWYFGGLASAGAACCTHPLDLIKVHLQTQQKGKIGIISQGIHIVRTDGILALYNGLSASLLRQLTYSTARFGIYETMKQWRATTTDAPMSFGERVGLASVAGACGGLVGTPGDLVNVRMQNDMKLPAAERRNYRHAGDGLLRVYREEGVARLFSGAQFATGRAVLMTVGQIAFYDQIKQTLLGTVYFADNITTHFTASVAAGAIATSLTQPLDVLKTRTMNARPGQYRSAAHCALEVAKLGPLAFFKGYVPAFIRLAPQTVLTFVFFEQLRLNFGRDPPDA